jgi:citrate lyase alpha subunit
MNPEQTTRHELIVRLRQRAQKVEEDWRRGIITFQRYDAIIFREAAKEIEELGPRSDLVEELAQTNIDKTSIEELKQKAVKLLVHTYTPGRKRQ